jgi:HlyD family secretion protein
MRKRIIPILIVIAVLAGVGYYVWSTYYGPGAASNSALGGSGTIEAEQIAVTPQVSGRIITAPAEEGAAVKAGQVLYQLDPATLKLQVQSAKAGVNAAQANYTHVKSDDNSTWADRQTAKAQVDQAKVAEQIAQVQVGYATIKAPADGILSNIAQKAGENAVPGTSLAMLSQVQTLTVTIYVPETRIGEVKMGQTGTLTTDSTNSYSAKVSYISSQAEFTPASIETKDQRTKLVYQVKLDITDSDRNLKPGMPADVVLAQ